ncbi:MAG: phosphatidylinositol-specific phospholipase C, partial [Pseudonocardiaceae bacterium]
MVTIEKLIPRPCWMQDVPDDTPVTALSIPGTHDAGCTSSVLGLGQTQSLGINDQLDVGIRFLDIRLAHYQDNLFVHHDVVYTDNSYADVLATCSKFLQKNPSETILMSIMEESRLDSWLGALAPSEVLGALYRGHLVTVGKKNTRCFEQAVKDKTWEVIGDAPLFYNFAAGPSDGEARTSTSAFTSETTLGDVRGKIVLLRRFEGCDDLGFDLTYWPRNQTFTSATSPLYHVQDRYLGLTDDDKYNIIIAHLEAAKQGDPKDLYITFCSAVDLTARGYAQTINPRLSDYLATSPSGRVGIIVMDYFEDPPDLV